MFRHAHQLNANLVSIFSVGCCDTPLPPSLPHPPSFNVGETCEAAEDMVGINIAQGRGDYIYLK